MVPQAPLTGRTLEKGRRRSWPYSGQGPAPEEEGARIVFRVLGFTFHRAAALVGHVTFTSSSWVTAGGLPAPSRGASSDSVLGQIEGFVLKDRPRQPGAGLVVAVSASAIPQGVSEWPVSRPIAQLVWILSGENK